MTERAMQGPEAGLGRPADLPATSYRRLPLGSTAAVVAVLACVTVVAWIVTFRNAESMADMVMGLGHIGPSMPMAMDAPQFLSMWAVMMVAMMAPTIAPLVLTDRAVRHREDKGVGATVLLVAGYFTLWWLVGILALMAFLWFHDLSPSAGDSRWLPALSGGVLLIAGVYQFTSRKARCLQACCRPLALITQRAGRSGVGDAFRRGWLHGLDCLGCCWAAMLVLLVVGLMNVVWMFGLSLLFLAEKHSPRALHLSRIVGGALVLLGVAVVIHPTLFHTISGVSATLPS
jgi:predicted metal-binding membrane protein